MLHDIELFMPTLFPVVLESKTAAVATSLPALADLDLAAFSGFAHDDLTMAARRIGESARALLPAGDAVTGTKLAVLTAPYESLEAGTIAYVVETAAGRTAFLVYEAQADAPSGYVQVRRSLIPLAPAAQAQKTTGDSTGDSLLSLASMAAPKLPGPAGVVGSVVMGIVNFFLPDGPSDAEVIIEAIKKAIDEAVVELESFMVEQQLKTIETVVIGDAYDWLKSAAAQAKKETTLRGQFLFAQTAVVEMKTHINLLRPWCKLLTKISLPDIRANLRARKKALKLLACGAAALFTLLKLRLQFNAFLAVNEKTEDMREKYQRDVRGDLVELKLAVLGTDREIPEYTGDPKYAAGVRVRTAVAGGLVRAYMDMYGDLVRARADCIQIQPPVTIGGLKIRTWGKLVDPYRKIDQDLNSQDWINFQKAAGLPGEFVDASDVSGIEFQKLAYVQAVTAAFAREDDMPADWSTMDKYISITHDWDKAVLAWSELGVETGVATQIKAVTR